MAGLVTLNSSDADISLKFEDDNSTVTAHVDGNLVLLVS